MEQYISKSSLVAEIENRIKELQNLYKEDEEKLDSIQKTAILLCIDECKVILSFIDKLEVKDVDLKKELVSWRHNHFHGRRDKEASGEYLERVSQLDLAKHFFELGLASQLNWQDIRLISEIGEEFMNSEESDSCTDDETYYGAILNKIKQLGRDYKTQRQEIRELNKTQKGE